MFVLLKNKTTPLLIVHGKGVFENNSLYSKDPQPPKGDFIGGV
ncbi:hypothetical protein M33023_02070 [Candidatus Phytoplasma asteris]|uniref:Uncharacterized protein n=1 Tax=Candidatus Phytoplasma asteris TaxID=85620 RepID=A0ABZ2YEP7_9MOLU